MLHVENMKASYGQSQVLHGVTLSVREGEITSLLGRNGMGKTTTVRGIMGLISSRCDRLLFRGRNMAGAVPENVARWGIGLVPEGRQVFTKLTVRENLVATALPPRSNSTGWTIDAIYEMFPRLRERHKQYADRLSGGEQQMLAIGRALMTNPALLVLDEATEGLAPENRREIWTCLRKLRSQGQSILIIDKNLEALKAISDRHYIIERGRTVWSGTSLDMESALGLVMKHLTV
jgi:branched-chain amino acid transport system ATP-binding protein